MERTYIRLAGGWILLTVRPLTDQMGITFRNRANNISKSTGLPCAVFGRRGRLYLSR